MSDAFEPRTPFEGYVFAKLEGLDKKVDQVNGTLKDHEQRLDATAQDIAKAKGWASALGAVFGFLASFVRGFIGNQK